MLPLPGGPPPPLEPLPEEPLVLQEILLAKRLAGVLIGTGGSNVSRVSAGRKHSSGVKGGPLSTVWH